jgi:hypothetical protein
MEQVTNTNETSVTPVEGNNNAQVQVAQEYDIDAFLEKRKEFIEKVNKIMVEGKDYHIIKNKKSMAKGGAEKIGSIFNWQASFKKDSESLEMFGESVKGTVAFICTLTKDGTFIGEGRGAAMLSRNENDPNRTIKMAQKSAFIDGILRSSGLSDFYTQDLEDMNLRDDKPQNNYNPNRQVYKPQNKKPNQPPQINAKDYILQLLNKRGYRDEELINKEIIEEVIKYETGIEVTGTPENLKEIVSSLFTQTQGRTPEQPPAQKNTAPEAPKAQPQQNTPSREYEVVETSTEPISPAQLNLLRSLIEQKLLTPKMDHAKQLSDLKYFYGGNFKWIEGLTGLAELSADRGKELINFLIHQRAIT